MKKIYLSLFMGAVATASMAQVTAERFNETRDVLQAPTFAEGNLFDQMPGFAKAPGDPIFTEDFAGGLTSGWTTSGADGALWLFDTDGPNGNFSSTTQIIASTTVSNGFMIFDADASNPAAPYTNRVGSLVSPVISMTGVTNAILTFQHKYRTCCASDFYPRLELTDDGFASSTEIDITIPGTSVNDVPATTTAQINLASWLGTISNPSNVQFRFTWEGSSGTSHYFWMIDDVNIYESHNNDLYALTKVMVSGALEIPYYSIPVNQIAPITFSGEVRNDGTQTSTGVQLDVTLNNGGGTVSSTPTTIAGGAMDSLITAAFTSTATAPTNYSITYDFAMNEVDGVPTNNSFTDAIAITNNEYAVHNGTATSFIGALGGQAGQPLKIGNLMEVMADDRISSMYIRLNTSTTNVGQDFYGEVYYFDGTDYVFLESTEIITVTGSNNGTKVQLDMLNPVDVTAGMELLVLACHYGDPTQNLRFATAQRVDFGIVAGFDGSNSLFGLTNPKAVMVGLHMDPSASVDHVENVAGVNVYPNPAADNVSITYSLDNTSDVRVEVRDFTGKLITVANDGVQTAGGHKLDVSLANLSSGVYYVNIVSEDSNITKKFVKK